MCPIPANFRQTGVADVGGGTLQFDYAWDSSTGNLADLSNCTLSERVTYGGGNPFVWPMPPWNGSTPNPTILSVPGIDGVAQDNHSTRPFVKPYQAATFTATQFYRYTCTCANSGNVVNIEGPLAIVRTVSQNSDGTFAYTITKSGSSATVNPLP